MPLTTSRVATTLSAVTQGASACYVGFSTTAINADGTGYTEPSGSDAYARIAVSASEWTTTGRRRATNVSKSFAAAPTGSWGTLTHFFLSNSATIGGGTIEAYGTLSLAITPTVGVTPSIASGQLFVELPS